MNRDISILQWNATCSLAAVHSLIPILTTDPSPPTVILLQEPPWYQVGLQPSLTDPTGTLVLNVPSLPGYTAVLPPATWPRVVTYVSRTIPSTAWSVLGAASSGTNVLTIEIRPPPQPAAPPILPSELTGALADTSNLSAPGLSGIGYCPLKWVVDTYPEAFSTTACTKAVTTTIEIFAGS